MKHLSVSVVSLYLAKFSSSQHFSPPAIGIYHDVCVTKLGGCNRAYLFDREFTKKSELPPEFVVGKSVSGVTAMLTANHGWFLPKVGQGDEISSDRMMYDWTNYEHWVESCYLFHAMVNNYAQQINASVHKYDKIKDVLHIGLPQVRPQLKGLCDNIPNVPGLFASTSFGEKVNDPTIYTDPSYNKEVPPNALVSQGYIAFARAATLTLQQVLSDHSHSSSKATTSTTTLETGASSMPSTTTNVPDILYCDDMMPKKMEQTVERWVGQNQEGKIRQEVTCFDTVIEVDPNTPHLVEHSLPLNSGMKQSHEQFIQSVKKILEIPHSDESSSKNGKQMFEKERVITLLTRNRGPRWKNRDFLLHVFQNAIKLANEFHQMQNNDAPIYKLNDAGHAEDFGIFNGCYVMKEQINLWSKSWLVISPHGAHESNVIFMNPESSGLIESFACGHRQTFFETFANQAHVKYHFAQETDYGLERINCEGNQLGRTFLKRERDISFEHDTLLEELYHVLGVPKELQEYPIFPRDRDRFYNSIEGVNGSIHY